MKRADSWAEMETGKEGMEDWLSPDAPRKRYTELVIKAGVLIIKYIDLSLYSGKTENINKHLNTFGKYYRKYTYHG